MLTTADRILATALGRRGRAAIAEFRVMALHGDHSRSLITLAENLRQAVHLAKSFCDETRCQSRSGAVAVHVEEWRGTLLEGEWRRVADNRGGFSRRLGTNSAAHAKPADIGDFRDPKLPRSGDTVPCVLLPEKTRRGGWKARLGQRELAGPITNSTDVPGSAQPGQRVMLRVAAVCQDGKSIQFQWQQTANSL